MDKHASLHDSTYLREFFMRDVSSVWFRFSLFMSKCSLGIIWSCKVSCPIYGRFSTVNIINNCMNVYDQILSFEDETICVIAQKYTLHTTQILWLRVSVWVFQLLTIQVSGFYSLFFFPV